jgi:uncharacterized protein YkwD
MHARNTAVSLLLLGAACAGAAPTTPTAPSPVAATSTPTPFLPKGFTGVSPSEAVVTLAPQPTITPSVAPAPGFPFDRAALGVNLFRQGEGLHELRLEDDLDRLAQERASRLAEEGTLRHTANLAAALEALGYHGRLAEHAVSVSADAVDPVGTVLQALLTDADHRANLLDPDFRHLGQGAARDGEWWYFVQLLAERGPGA